MNHIMPAFLFVSYDGRFFFILGLLAISLVEIFVVREGNCFSSFWNKDLI